jgi:zinc protease
MTLAFRATHPTFALAAACCVGAWSIVGIEAQVATVQHVRPPVSQEILHVTLPAPEEADLPNGVQVWLVEDHRLPTVTVQIAIRDAGGYFDPPGRADLARVTAEMMREGTTIRTGAQIAEELEALGASLVVDASGANADVRFRATCLSQDFGALTEIMSSILISPSFTEEALIGYKQRRQTEVQRLQSNPSVLAEDLAKKQLFGTHPNGRRIRDDTFQRFTRDELIENHRVHYTPDHVEVMLTGDMSLKEATAMLRATLGNWRGRTSGSPTPPRSLEPATTGVSLIDRPGSVQTNFFIAARAPSQRSSELEAFDLLNRVLGANVTSRLFRVLREEKGYVYMVATSHVVNDVEGYWRAIMTTRTENTVPALRETLLQVQRLSDELVTEDEIGAARNAAVARFALSLESPETVLSAHALQRRLGFPSTYWARYPMRVAAVTRESLRQIARKYLRRDQLQISIVGDARQLRSSLAAFGPVKEYAPAGELVSPSR